MDNNSKEHNLLKGYSMLLYFAGSMIMYEPSEECVVDFWKNGILKRLPVSSSNPNYILAASLFRESCEDKSICGKMLRDDYTRLFGNNDLALSPAYESIFRKRGNTLSGENSLSVTEFYNSYGWVSKFKGKINDDHLGIELLFLTLLIEKFLELDDAACQREMRIEIRRFIDNHILSWVQEWNEKLQLNAKTLCFKGIGILILACSEDIYSIMNQKTLQSFNLGQLKN
jgi:TorA maturation chaperone TorD